MVEQEGPEPGETFKAGCLLAGMAVVGVVFVASLLGDDEDPAPVRPVEPRTVEVVYELSGTARSADITYTGSGGSTEQQTGVDVPLVTTNGVRGLRITMAPGDFAYLSAQNKGDGTITCTIRAGATTVDTATSRGEFAIASCSGTVR